jgi:glutamate dehydrogenase (NAD(P)+)
VEGVSDIADDVGPAKVTYVHEPSVGLQAVLVIDTRRSRPSDRRPAFRARRFGGGVPATGEGDDPQELSSRLAHGGGKSVLWGDPWMLRERKEALLRCFARAARSVAQEA